MSMDQLIFSSTPIGGKSKTTSYLQVLGDDEVLIASDREVKYVRGEAVLVKDMFGKMWSREEPKFFNLCRDIMNIAVS